MPAIARSEPFREQACPLGVCDGSGWILGPEDVARPCECREQRLKRGKARGVTSALPSKYRGVSFDRPPVPHLPKEAVRETRRYIEKLDANLAAGRGIWFLGDIGTGKTTLAMLISKAAIEKGHTVSIYSTPTLLTKIRSSMHVEKGDAYASFFERLISVDLLHLDDLGAERQTDWVLEQLYSIVNQRYEEERAIMFTTDMVKVESPEEIGKREKRGKRAELPIEEQIGRRTFSRLTEMCGDPVMLPGEDQRSTGQAPATVIDLAP
ncbi:MAG TPA: ATP-binding protein [Solirubrobacterales bacterium]|nr:ATP-binding protein [Solirubrobacterales bacterium]